MSDELLSSLEKLAAYIDSQGILSEPEVWIKENEGFYLTPVIENIYKSFAEEIGLDTSKLQVELLKFEPGSKLELHHHDESEGVITQVNLLGASSGVPLQRYFLDTNNKIQKCDLDVSGIFRIPKGYVHGFENDSDQDIVVLSIQSAPTEADTHWDS